MRTLLPALALALSLLACQTGGDLGGGDPGWELDDAPFSDAESLQDTGQNGSSDPNRVAPTLDSAECIESEDDVPQGLSAAVSGTSVTFIHEGVGTWCSADWGVTASVSTSNQVSIEYSDSSGTDTATADCWCHWTLTYTLSELATGDYTASALGDSASFAIE